MNIQWVTEAIEAQALREAGYCPVECSFGEESVVDGLQMDHHGPLSHLEGVAIRAYRDHFGARRPDPRFVVTGAADADATFAIAALAGFLPHPSRKTEFSTSPEYSRTVWKRDITNLVALINRADIDPIGLRLEESEDGLRLLLFKRLSSGVHDAASFCAGVDHWRLLLGPNPPVQLLEAVKAEEQQRVAEARAAQVQIISPDVAFVESKAWGYDIWYAEVRPVIVAYQTGEGRVSIGCRDLTKAQRLFGPSGLRAVFPHLHPPGWGGRETIGGSPRGARLEREQALAAAKQLASHIPTPDRLIPMQSPSNPQLTGTPSRTDEAIEFSTKAHASKLRKGTDIPYITHPFGVAMILARAGFGEEMIVAALLHDTVEDADVTIEELRQRFGDDVADIVAGCSEPDKSLPWEERKRHTLQTLRNAPLAVRAVTCADKLHNLRSLRADHAGLGDGVWKRFNRGRTEQTWLFQSLAATLRKASGAQPDAALCRHFFEEVSEFFGSPTE